MSTPICVAVCTNRPPSDVAESVGALRRQVDGDVLAVVTSGLDDAAVDWHRRVFGVPVLAEPRPGLSRARNRAIAWAASEGAEVLAFVDDDAVVASGWWEALGRRWEEAPDDVGCVGGPIHPRFAAPRPEWVSDEILPALTLLDRGPDVRDLDPSTEAVYGANISFRVEPLRRIGGFDPALGHSTGRTYFAEEDEAQRALARIGYRTRYVPDAAVDHVIGADRLTRSSFVRRRFAYGAAVGARRGRPLPAALAQAASSGVGAAAAGLGGDGRTAMERVVRAAENAGAVYGRLIEA